jgi:hypothetical protein
MHVESDINRDLLEAGATGSFGIKMAEFERVVMVTFNRFSRISERLY